MKIAVNLYGLSGGYHGHEVFTENILQALEKNRDKETEILRLGRRDSQSKRSRITNVLFQQFAVPIIYLRSGADFLLSPTPNFPILLFRKNVVVIHDCAYRRFGDEAGMLARLYMRIMYRMARHAGAVFTVSEFSKKELMDLYKIPERKITVISEGVPHLPQIEKEAIPQTLIKFSIKQPYFLYLGATRRRKNVLGTLRAFREFTQMNARYQLVLAGSIDKRFLDVEKEIKKLDLGGKVIQTGRVSDEEKVALYQGCEAFLLPSLYEGFGLPVLEAQSLGVPIIVSRESALPETAGDGALYVDPRDFMDIQRGMAELAGDNRLRKEIVIRGKENIQRFSWDKGAQKIVDFLNENPSR